MSLISKTRLAFTFAFVAAGCGDQAVHFKEVSCSDQIKNESETDVDCGGTCDGCGEGRGCLEGADCKSMVCLNVLCGGLPSSCTDGKKDGRESDVDCGGGECPLCPDGKGCGNSNDCKSGVCKDGTCAAPSCTDNLKNGMETDVDCGGPTCPRCAIGKSCH